MEAGVVVASGAPIFWHLPPGRSSGSLPDSRGLWDVLWEHRTNLDGFAHSHPGSGYPGPSGTDLTTFEAVEAGLGRRLKWWITSSDHMIVLTWNDSNPGYDLEFLTPEEEPGWILELRRVSALAAWGRNVTR